MNWPQVAFRKETALSRHDPQSMDSPSRQYCFGEFTLDLEGGFLRRGLEEVKLRPKSFEVLTYLVEHHGRLVTKRALMESIWPDTATTENSLAQCLTEIRQALNDDGQRSIRTVAGRGYLFAAPVTTSLSQSPREFPDNPSELSPLYARRASRFAKRRNIGVIFSLLALALAVVALVAVWRSRPAQRRLAYTQITNFTDSAVAPTLSPDGRIVAFFRSDDWFLTPDQIYVKLLPAGEPVQITHDPRLKYSLAFSPDGSQIAYTALETQPLRWNTFTISSLGGEPRLLLTNAAGLTWVDAHKVLFSEIRAGAHMGIVTATENRFAYRQIYFPGNERAMAHLSYASPDRRWALVAEMDPVWSPCRLIPLDGSSAGRRVGPDGQCTSAAWSPEGRWMYFGADVKGNRHLWRQRFPDGVPEQITFGATEEEGLAVPPDGRSLITSLGIRESAVWIHDRSGERALSSEGYAVPMRVFPYSSVKFSVDGKLLFYLLQRDSQASASELWRTDVVSRKSEPVLRGVSMIEYDLSSDGKEVLFSTQQVGKSSQLWLAPLDRSSPPKMIGSTGEAWPRFGAADQVLFQLSQDKANYLYRMNRNGSDRSRVVPYPVGNIEGASPDGRWIIVGTTSLKCGGGALAALSTTEGAERCICQEPCMAAWAPDGRFLYLGLEPPSRTGPGKTIAIPVPPGEMLPTLPVTGVHGLDDVADFRGARIINGWGISPGPDPSIFAFLKTTMHRNLFEIPLPND
jgi:DNA-binding winged helix-turn-helix (wHTH) protein/Tol biopolymer transport system component